VAQRFSRELGLLIRIRIAGPIHAYVVICEYEQPGRTTYLHFLHVAARASGFLNWAGLGIAVLTSDGIRDLVGVAGDAFAIVTRFVPLQRLVRIMTPDAADSPIPSVEAFTILQPVRLKSNIALASNAHSYDRRPGAMTLSAEVRNLLGGKLLQIAGSRIIDPFESVDLMLH